MLVLAQRRGVDLNRLWLLSCVLFFGLEDPHCELLSCARLKMIVFLVGLAGPRCEP